MGAENVTATALLSNRTRAMAAGRHSQPGWPERRERTVAGGWGPRPARGTLQSCSAASVVDPVEPLGSCALRLRPVPPPRWAEWAGVRRAQGRLWVAWVPQQSMLPLRVAISGQLSRPTGSPGRTRNAVRRRGRVRRARDGAPLLPLRPRRGPGTRVPRELRTNTFASMHPVQV